MVEAEFEEFVTALDNVQRAENFGYSFFFVGDDHRLPFMTIARSDNEYDSVSRLDRDGVFRLNIGVRKETFRKLTAEIIPDSVDYAELDTFLPHPDYAKQHFVCILNPAGQNVELTKQLIKEAHGIAAERAARKSEA